MSHLRWQQLALITVALCCASAGAALRVAHAPDPVATLAWIALGGILGAPFIWWRVHRQQDAALADAMHTHGALGGVPCALPLDTPAWGSLVLTATAWVWEPNQRAAARGQRQVLSTVERSLLSSARCA